MADVAEEGVVITACSSLLVAASFGAATVLNKRKKRKNSTWVKQYIRERESLGGWSIQCPFVGVGYRQ